MYNVKNAARNVLNQPCFASMFRVRFMFSAADIQMNSALRFQLTNLGVWYCILLKMLYWMYINTKDTLFWLNHSLPPLYALRGIFLFPEWIIKWRCDSGTTIYIITPDIQYRNRINIMLYVLFFHVQNNGVKLLLRNNMQIMSSGVCFLTYCLTGALLIVPDNSSVCYEYKKPLVTQG